MFFKMFKDMWICLFYYQIYWFLSKILTIQLLCGKTAPLGRFSLMSQADLRMSLVVYLVDTSPKWTIQLLFYD